MKARLPRRVKLFSAVMAIVAALLVGGLDGPPSRSQDAPTLEPPPAPFPEGFRGVQPPLVGTAPASRGGALPLPTPSSYIPTWGVLYTDNFQHDFVTGKADPPWSVELTAPVLSEEDNRYLSLQVPESALPIKTSRITDDVAIVTRVRLHAGDFRVNLREDTAGSYRIEFETSGRVTLTQNETTLAEAAFENVGDWLSLNVTAIGSEIWVAVDDATLIHFTSDQPVLSGRITFSTGSNATQIDLDDVYIEGHVDMSDLIHEPPVGTRDEPGLNCELIADYDWCAPVDFRIDFYGFTGSPQEAGLGYHGDPAPVEPGYSYLRRHVGYGHKILPEEDWLIGRIVVLYDYTPGQNLGEYWCFSNRIELYSTSSVQQPLSSNFVTFASLTAGSDNVAVWSDVQARNLKFGFGFRFQHGCRNAIDAPLPDPAGAMTIKKIVFYGYGESPFGENFPPTSTPTPAATDTCGSGGDICGPQPTSAPTAYFELALADFGVQLIYDGDFWDAVRPYEESNILEAVRRIADALELLGVSGATPEERFRKVFIQSQVGGSDLAITFLRLPPSDQPQPTPTSYEFYYDRLSVNCLMNDTEDNIAETALGYVIACRGFQSSPSWNPEGVPGYGILAVEAVIHELGHVIDGRTGLELRNQVHRAPLYDCRVSDEPIMRPLDAVDPRGLEGWGSVSTSATDVSRFQQNTIRTPAETTADMFLNWVFRITESQHPYFDPSQVAVNGQDYLCGYKPPNPNESHIPRVNDGSGRIQVAHDPARTEWENATWLGFLNIDASGNFAIINYPDGTRREHLPGNARFARTHNSLYNTLVEQ